MGAEGAAALWRGAAAAASAPHTRPAAALQATHARWNARFPDEPFDSPLLFSGPLLRQPLTVLGDGPAAAAAAVPGPAERSEQSAAPAPCSCPAPAGAGVAGSKLRYDILAACIRQFDFWHSVSRLSLISWTLHIPFRSVAPSIPRLVPTSSAKRVSCTYCCVEEDLLRRSLMRTHRPDLVLMGNGAEGPHN